MSANYPSSRSSLGGLLKVSLVANVFEWYEISLYGYMVGILGQLFFPSADPTASMIKALLVFTLSYLIKPLGSFYFGWLGDRYSRTRSLKNALLIVTLPTAFIGLLPTWQTAGLSATVLLVALRVIQGFGVGGEGTMSATYVFEASPPRYRSLLCSVVHVSAILGILSASVVKFLLFHYFTQEVILDWAWRIPFLLAIPLSVGIAWIRLSISEQALLINKPNASKTVQPSNTFTIRSVVPTFFIMAFFLAAGHLIFTSWFPIYLRYFLGYSENIANASHTIVLLVRVVLCLLVGYLSYFWGFKRFIITSILGMMLTSIPLFLWLTQGSETSVFITQLLFVFLLSGIDGTFIEMMAIHFPKAIRGRGMSLAYTLLSTLIGGMTPLLCSQIMYKTNFVLFPAFYITFFSLLALIAVWYMKTDTRPNLA
jgi:MHS family proline/betaine transporter-like MFS transporter